MINDKIVDNNSIALKGCTVEFVEHIVALVYASGSSCFLHQNSSKPKNKYSKIIKTSYKVIFIMLLVCILLPVILMLLLPNKFFAENFDALKNDWLQYCSFFLLLSEMIPLSLVGYTTTMRVFDSIEIDWHYENECQRNSNALDESKTLPSNNDSGNIEDLGVIQVLFLDKTGTCTQNEMEARGAFIINYGLIEFNGNSDNEIKSLIFESGADNTAESKSPELLDFIRCILINNDAYLHPNCKEVLNSDNRGDLLHRQRTLGQYVIASSIDEVKLIEKVVDLDCFIQNKSRTELEIKFGGLHHSERSHERYVFVEDLSIPFNNDNKFMIVTVQNERDGKYRSFIKGSYEKVKNFCRVFNHIEVEENLEKFELQGNF